MPLWAHRNGIASSAVPLFYSAGGPVSSGGKRRDANGITPHLIYIALRALPAATLLTEELPNN